MNNEDVNNEAYKKFIKQAPEPKMCKVCRSPLLDNGLCSNTGCPTRYSRIKRGSSQS
jgi:hypothetical protein